MMMEGDIPNATLRTTVPPRLAIMSVRPTVAIVTRPMKTSHLGVTLTQATATATTAKARVPNPQYGVEAGGQRSIDLPGGLVGAPRSAVETASATPSLRELIWRDAFPV